MDQRQSSPSEHMVHSLTPRITMSEGISLSIPNPTSTVPNPVLVTRCAGYKIYFLLLFFLL